MRLLDIRLTDLSHRARMRHAPRTGADAVPASEAEGDGFEVARGILTGMLIGAVFWAAVAAAWFML